ncbi:RNA polymerase sigma-70 factor, ECF subfamily [Saccharopolyspora antimicrobica]|uniref:RNA polymerase sigma-70 factor (ECF subfamily) n=1 Tax=Saccharopolyspora antimicrobica TaxID=455193 RepID=A0A1I4X1U2_9PSEU|nr:RNA polymerase sigma factor [Saccharopolyspora antimicrobica]RKT84268.1 RNA polymerase sigma-70 factor (ECF subfamily) [Saccharopolyspora antimicrobica]SFN19817.1 RNA polymerase sigma-70 factor, ECF subfamily [Saccharopolyspora antimicrobica]
MREEQSDEELLRAVARGDRAAFDALYQRNAGWLAARLRRRCDDPGLAAEVLQDCFLLAWRSARSFDPQGNAAAWLWTIASRRLIDAHRRRGARVRSSGEPAESALVADSAESEVMDRTLAPELAAAIGLLSPELRAVLQATALDGRTVRETSALLGIPEGTVKTRMRKARRMLKEALA